jgi:hypothetical protein
MKIFASSLMVLGFFCLPVQAQSNMDNTFDRLIFNSTSTYSTTAQHKTKGIVYFVRGILGVFSRGLDQMGETLNDQGINATVINHQAWKKAAVTIASHHKKNKKDPIILIGHSWGANAILRIAKFLQQRDIKVQYFVTFEPNINLPVPANVESAANYYLSNSLLGLKLKKQQGSSGHLQNVDLITLDGVGHFNIEKQTRVQNQVIKNIHYYLGTKPTTQ